MLGLRLVKRSVTQDGPGTYRLFYADGVGSPGTDLTFFAWPGAQHGREGAGQATTVALAVPQTGLEYWMKRLASHDVAFEGPVHRFDEEVIAFSDVHGQALELVAAPDTLSRQWHAWDGRPAPAEAAIRGLHRVTVQEAAEDPTVPFLTGTLGFRAAGAEAGRRRFAVGPGGPGARPGLLPTPGAPPGPGAVRTIHPIPSRPPAGEQHPPRWQQTHQLGA